MTPTEEAQAAQAQEQIQNGAVNVNNLDLFNFVEEGVDPNASVTDQAPPPPSKNANGKIPYRIKISLAKDAGQKALDEIIAGTKTKDGAAHLSGDDDKQTAAALRQMFPDNTVTFFRSKDGRARPMLILDHQIVADAAGNEIKGARSVREWTSPMVMSSVHTSAVDTLLVKLTGQSYAGQSDMAKIQALHQLAESDQAVYTAEIEWRGEVKGVVKGKETYVTAVVDGKPLGRMENFPARTLGTGETVYAIPTEDDNGAEVRVTWEVTKFL